MGTFSATASSSSKATAPFSAFMGYDRGENGEFVLNLEQAKVVKLIYAEFIKGFSFVAIARKLTEMGIKSPKGLKSWNPSTIKSILTNEKYKGCALLQKRYTADYLTKKVVVNNGAVPQYYVEDHHPAIIEAETFDRVQDLIAHRSREKHFSGSTMIATNARVAQNQDEYSTAYDAAVGRYESTKAERDSVAAEIRQKGIRRR